MNYGVFDLESLGDGYGLLFHGFVDGCLVKLVHVIKLINTTHTLGEGT